MSSSSSSSNPSLFFFFFLIISSLSLANSSVPPSGQFKFINEGELGPFVTEYGADYRVISIFNSPFQLAFYNTTPNAFTLALRMGTTRSESLFRWVWEANRGNPVRDNATFTLGADGNLVLAEADGKVTWQTNTANKGVVGLKLLPNGNMVLHDSSGKFIWQSFDHPTDTLLVGQSFRSTGPVKLVSRDSAKNNVDGRYSLVLEPKTLGFYYKSKNSPKPLLYYSPSNWFFVNNGTLEHVTFNSNPESDENFAFELRLDYGVEKSIDSGNRILARPKYNSTLSFLRLDVDGNLRIYTFYDKVDIGAWEVTFTLLNRLSDISECQLPERCGNFGLCEESQCVGCPLPNGILGWSKKCEPVKLLGCRPKDFNYYKVEGVEHFVSKFTKGDGPMKDSECGNKCTKDCKCLGYFYHKESSMCWIVYDLKTLTKVENSSHLGYIKAPKK